MDEMVMVGTFLATIALLLLIFQGPVVAWSHQQLCGSSPPTATDRRAVLHKVTATTFLGLGINAADAIAAPAAVATSRRVASSADNTNRASSLRPERNNNKKIYEPPPKSLDGKIIVITGANSGLGLESAKRLAAAGGTIVLTARTDAKGRKAIIEVQEYLTDRLVQNTNIYAATLNLDDLDSVRSFPQRYSTLLGSDKKIDVLLNNAGVAAIPQRELTKDGFERTFQTNHLGPFCLTAVLFPYLNRNEMGSRIINVSSYAHEFATLTKSSKSGLDIDNLNGEIEYSGLGWPAYCRSKLENILFTQELQRRADEAGLDWLTVTALHPGRVATDIWRTTYFGVDRRGARRPTTTGGTTDSLQSFISNVFYSSVLTVEEGANTQVMLAASGEREGTAVKGQYYDERSRLKKVNDFARDESKARYLWNQSQEMTGIEFVVK